MLFLYLKKMLIILTIGSVRIRPSNSSKCSPLITKYIYIYIYIYIYTTATCFGSDNYLCLKTINKVNSKFDLKNKEALHINWRKPKLIHNKIRQFSLFHYIFCPPFALFCRFFLFFLVVVFFFVSL